MRSQLDYKQYKIKAILQFCKCKKISFCAEKAAFVIKPKQIVLFPIVSIQKALCKQKEK